MWTTDALSNSSSWDLFTFIFFGFMLYKAFTKPFRSIIWSALKSPFAPLTSDESTKDRIKATLIFIAILVVLIFVIGGWLFELIKVIKIFI